MSERSGVTVMRVLLRLLLLPLSYLSASLATPGLTSSHQPEIHAFLPFLSYYLIILLSYCLFIFISYPLPGQWPPPLFHIHILSFPLATVKQPQCAMLSSDMNEKKKIKVVAVVIFSSIHFENNFVEISQHIFFC